ncbi:MAG: hypothetical protein RIT04_196 [Candidatus Parcubacteria bacterium]|jgi:glycerate-2-kinase
MEPNFTTLATNKNRKDALDIVQAGLNAINTRRIIREAFSLSGNTLTIRGNVFNLDQFKSLHVIGFGKAVCEAVSEIDAILGEHIDGGITISTESGTCETVDIYEGSHPMPSEHNVLISKKIIDLSEKLQKDDLVLVISSGGGSSLLCWPPEECEDGKRLYAEFLKTGGSISELNTVRKHISSIKGGGLAKALYPAHVVGLVFCDVPGGVYADVASGPTYLDTTTIADAQAIISKYSLGSYELKETPKDSMYFEKVLNIPMVSNQTALDAMKVRAQELGFEATIAGNDMYGTPTEVCKHMNQSARTLLSDKKVVIAGGEPSLHVPEKHGKGGRNQFVALTFAQNITSGQVFISIGSDGKDNTLAAGAIVDSETSMKIKKAGFDLKQTLENFDSYPALEACGDLIITGSTGANVSDIMLLLEDKKSC